MDVVPSTKGTPRGPTKILLLLCIPTCVFCLVSPSHRLLRPDSLLSSSLYLTAEFHVSSASSGFEPEEKGLQIEAKTGSVNMYNPNMNYQQPGAAGAPGAGGPPPPMGGPPTSQAGAPPPGQMGIPPPQQQQQQFAPPGGQMQPPQQQYAPPGQQQQQQQLPPPGAGPPMGGAPPMHQPPQQQQQFGAPPRWATYGGTS